MNPFIYDNTILRTKRPQGTSSSRFLWGEGNLENMQPKKVYNSGVNLRRFVFCWVYFVTP